MSDKQKRCRTCEHWNSDPRNMPPKPGWGFCDLASEDNIADTLAMAMTDDSFDAGMADAMFATAPLFGCVQHEQKADLKETVSERNRRKFLEMFPGARIVDWRDD